MPKHKPRKIVAAGWYVGAGIAFLLFGLPPEWLNNTPTRALFCLLGIMCLGGAAYEWWFRKPDQSITSAPPEPSAPDVSLRFQLPNYFELHNYGGDAMDVSIATVTIEEYYPYPLEVHPARVPEQTARFPKVDVDAGASVRVTPVFTYLVPMESTMAKFLDAFIEHRQITRAEPPPPENVTPQEIRERSARMWRLRDEPVEIEMRLVYTSRATRRSWGRIETLHYDPKTRLAHVTHGIPAEITTPDPQANGEPETAQERYYNLKLQAEGPELANKIGRGHVPDGLTAVEEQPDVLLELSGGPVVTRRTADSLEPVNFAVYNNSANATAMHVQIAELSSSDYYDGGYWTGDAATPAGATVATTKLRFALVPHVEGKRRIEVEPINPGFSVPDRLMQEVGKMPANQRAQDVSVGLWWFIGAARKARVLKAREPASESERRMVSQTLDNEPIDVPVCVTYSNAQATRFWERTETLHYDPPTRAAYISHGQPLEITGRDERSKEAGKPAITIDVIRKQDHVEVVVRNDGDTADVWGVLQLTGAVPAPFHNLWCRWDVLSNRATIARGEERRAVLADRMRDPKKESSGQALRWHIYCYGGGPMTLISDELNPQPSTDPTGDIVIEGAILSDPESANGAQSFRVTLKPSGTFPNGNTEKP